MMNNKLLRRKLLALALVTGLLTGCGAQTRPNVSANGTSDASGAYQYTGTFDYARALASRSQDYEPGDAQLSVLDAALPQQAKDYTVMVYMIGSNLESQLGNGTKDLLEMERSGVDFQKTNVLVCTGGSVRWMGRVPNDRNCVMDLSRESEDRIVAQTEGNADMGAPETLSSFINFCCAQYPAQHYALILWDHGGGPLWGYGSDELFGSDSLLLNEMSTAMEQTPFSGTKNLDWVGFDACLMGNLECMALWSRYAEYFIGSEELEPGDGWDYSFLNTLNSSTDAKEITCSIVDHYGAYYERLRTEVYSPDVTLSCVDLKQVMGLSKSLDSLAKKLEGSVNGNGYTQVQKIRAESKSFGLIEGTKGEQPFSYDLVDLGDWAGRVNALYPGESGKVMEHLDRLVVKQYSNVEKTTGVSLYYPFQNKGQYSQMAGVYRQIAAQQGYWQFLDHVSAQWLSSKSRDWRLPTPTLNGEEYSLPLTQEQQENITAVYYTVLKPFDNGGYAPVFSRCKIEPDQTGLIRFPADPQIIFLQTDAGDNAVCPVVQLETGNNRSIYRTERTRLTTDHSTGLESFGMYDDDLLDVSVVMRRDEQTGELRIQTVNTSSDSASFGGKNSVNTKHYSGFYYYSNPYIPIQDAEGRPVSFTQWPHTSSHYLSSFLLDHSFSFEMKPASEQALDCLIQVEVEDINGEFYAATPVQVHANPTWREVRKKTGKGELTYRIEGDQATLTDYVGQDDALTIPEQVEGARVTAIGDSAFGKMSGAQGAGHFSRITLPDSIERIGRSAFAGCMQMKRLRLPGNLQSIGGEAFWGCSALKELTIPEGVTAIDAGAFGGCRELQHLELPSSLSHMGERITTNCDALKEITMDGQKDGSCPGCRLKDGVLFSADGTRLIAFPAAREGRYTVPEGTNCICYGAFTCTRLTSVQFPESLTELCNNAFRGCKGLEVPTFPAHLTTIGYHAFGADWYSLDLTPEVLEQQEVHIGPQVSFIGAGAFDSFRGRRFTVDPDNPWFSAVDGALCNGEGDVCIACTSTGQPVIVIPQGVTRFDWDILNVSRYYNLFSELDYDQLHVVLPDSVVSFSNYNSYVSDKVIFHCPRGSAAEQYAREYEFPFDDNLQIQYQTAALATPHGTAHYHVYADHAQLVSYEGTDAVLEVPETVEGVRVTVIGDGQNSIQEMDYSFMPSLEEQMSEQAEEEASRLRQVVLPDTVTRISSRAFFSCNLEELHLPEGLLHIGDYALAGVKSVGQLPESVEYLGSQSLRDWDGLFPIRPALRYYAPDAIPGNSNMTGFVMDGENDTYSVRDGLLYDRDGTTLIAAPDVESKLTIPDGTIQIGKNAVSNHNNLQELVLPGTLTSIGEYAFSYDRQLTSILLPSSLREIGSNAFYHCGQLTGVQFPEGLERIGTYAFSKCTQLGELSLPESLLDVGGNAFYDYDDTLWDGPDQSLTISSNLTQIGDNAFGSIPAESYVVAQDNPHFACVDGMLTDRTGRVLISCPSGKKGAVTVPDGTVYIEEFAFHGCTQITDLTIPESVAAIGDTSFNINMERDEYGTYKQHCPITFHCAPGSNAEVFAQKNNLTFDHNGF